MLTNMICQLFLPTKFRPTLSTLKFQIITVQNAMSIKICFLSKAENNILFYAISNIFQINNKILSSKRKRMNLPLH